MLRLNDNEVKSFLNSGLNEEDVKMIDLNYEIYRKYASLSLKIGIPKTFKKFKDDLLKLNKVKSSFESHNIIPDSIRSKKFEFNNIQGIFEDNVYSTYYDFFQELKKLNLKKYIKTEEIIDEEKVYVDDYELNILDISKIIFNKTNNYQTMNELEKVTRCFILESEIIKEAETVIKENIKIINNFKEYFSEEVFAIWGKYLYILLGFYMKALSHISPITSKSSQSIFFMSQEEMANFLNTGRTKIGYTLNTLALTGFIMKINKKQVPKRIIDNSKLYQEQLQKTLKKTSKVNQITFWSWIDLSDIDNIKYIETMTKKLIDSGITISDMDNKYATRIFGETVSDEVYAENKKSAQKSVKNRLENLAFKMKHSEFLQELCYGETNEKNFKKWLKKGTK
jgi:hypothetical protein